jgi:hypothetical protein
MKPWSIAIVAVAGIAIVALLVVGGDERGFARRARAQVNARPALELTGITKIGGPEQTLVVILDLEVVPPEAASLLAEVRNLVEDAKDQPPDQAKDSLEEALDKLDEAMDLIDEAADDTSNLAVKARLERINAALASVEDEIEARLDQL